MKKRGHFRLFMLATLVWAGFWVGGRPAYYQQYAVGFMACLDLATLAACVGAAYLVLRGVRRERRLKIAAWYAFYFTVPLALYDGLYCGIQLGHGPGFLTRFWYLSVFYVLPWVVFPLVATRLNRGPAAAGRHAGQVSNVHERQFALGPATVGALIDSLASAKDALWPGTSWPAMRFDRPLGEGAVGGHGPIRYAVEEYRPGRSIRFRFSAPRGFDGHHGFEVERVGDDAAILRHVLVMAVRGPARLTWPLAYRWLHDACIEDALARAQVSLGVPPLVRPWPLWVRILRRLLAGGRARAQGTPGRRPA